MTKKRMTRPRHRKSLMVTLAFLTAISLLFGGAELSEGLILGNTGSSWNGSIHCAIGLLSLVGLVWTGWVAWSRMPD